MYRILQTTAAKNSRQMCHCRINNYVEKPDDTIFEGNGLQIRNGQLTFHKEWSAGLPMIFPVICLLPSLLILIAIIVKNRRNIIAGFIIRD